jgi:hypothetical protein
MAGRGPAPKAVRSRTRATAQREAEMTEIEDDGELYGFDLPLGVLPDGAEWHPQTLELWNSLRRNPLLKNEPNLGWQFLVDTALLHHIFWSKGRWEYASEIRLRLAKIGITPEDRMRLKIKVTTPTEDAKRPAQAGPGSVSDIASRRARLSGS